ncbi:MAG: Sua5/YciO/YrdC/YwlC family protein [Kiritimatiellae bacterium]|nr:Sua5/YciO/YrdC/YwlC family protein [Kiritimatiellia bacterium]
MICVAADEEGLRKTASVLLGGGVAIIPTDTVYGLAAHPSHPEAVQRLYEIKHRSAAKPVALLADCAESAERFCGALPQAAKWLAAKGWPGALTIVAPREEGYEGVRVPDCEWTRNLCAMCGGVLRVTSANESGAGDAASAAAVSVEADIIADGGICKGGTASTVVKTYANGKTELLRQGAFECFELSLEDVRNALARGERVLMMMRHAERPHIEKDDPTFGANLPITAAGAEDALRVGRALHGACADEDVQFFSSPLRRTRMTAAKVAEGMGLAEKWNIATIPTDDYIGNSSPYFSDRLLVWETFKTRPFFDLVFEYIAKGSQCGFAPLAEATDAVEEFVMSRFSSRLGIFTTHDLYNAAFLSARHARPQGWTVGTWVDFLDSAAIFILPDGTRRYALVRT